MGLTYEELRRIQRLTREKPELTELPENFADAFIAYEEDKKRILNSSDSNIFAKKAKDKARDELRNARDVFFDIIDRRAGKVLELALLMVKTKSEVYNNKNITSPEQELLKKSIEVLNNHFDKVMGKVKKNLSSTNLIVCFKADVPEFYWNERVYGPFKKQDLANLPIEAVKLLGSNVEVRLNDEEVKK